MTPPPTPNLSPTADSDPALAPLRGIIGSSAAMNEVYRTYFKNPPARSAFGANGLALDARVEIECIAIVK